MHRGMKQKIVVVGVMVLASLVVAGSAFGDRIVLENGDTLTGTVERVMDGKVTLKTDYAGTIQIDVAKVKQISTEGPAEVHLTSGEVLKGKIKSVEDKKLAVEPSPERTAATVEMQSVKAINPPPVKWHGNIAAGGNLQSGNTDRAGASIAFDLSRRTEKDRISLRYLFNYGEENGEVDTRNHYGEAKYDYFLTPKFYAYLAGDVKNDKFDDTKLRFTVGPGLGYQVWDDPVKSLLFEAGVGYFNWDRYYGEDSDGLTARLGLDFRYQIFKWLAFTDRFNFYPTIGEGGEFWWRNEAALVAPLGSGWSLRLANILDYQSNPPAGVDKTDVQWIGALQYSF
jgi:putative salt-induced outer membrane protein YdiY